jgi:two-component system response regulator GlrR
LNNREKESQAPDSADALLAINLIGRSEALLRVIDIVKRIAEYDVVVSIYGETGTGKELIARALHYMSSRADGPFIPVNCGSLHDSLVESELFGHKRGAFTDASSDRAGFIDRASGGTLFLDEIHTLSRKAQVSLLRFLQDMQYERVGGGTLKKSDARIVVASNIDLTDFQKRGAEFRDDLFYRLDMMPVRLPPLRERREDILLLADHFLEKFKIHHGLEDKRLSPSTQQWLIDQDWPGNVRQLQNCVHRGLLLAEGTEIGLQHLQPDHSDAAADVDFLGDLPFKDAKIQVLDRFEHDYLRAIMVRCNGNVSLAAQRASTDRSTLGRLLKKHHINHRDFQTG